jgi:two-component system, NtrC family, response regulator AtoC
LKTHRRPNLKIHEFQGMLTSCAMMTDFFELIQRVARTESPVLIRGDSGTGKELVAKAIHNLGVRQSKSFHAVNCAMLTPELVNSELFGHVKGSFTGAVSDHKGFFEESNGGTLFLDEVAELPVNAQSRILRVLQEQVIMKLGSTKAKAVDVRILSATHQSLRSAVKNGDFREDLMYRLRVVPIFLPPLAKRGRDVEMLLWHFIDLFNKGEGRKVNCVHADAMDAIRSYIWPGNVRELRNNVEYAFAVGEGESLKLSDLTPELSGDFPSEEEGIEIKDFTDKERKRIVKALNDAEGRKGLAAENLGMDRSTLWRKMKSYGLS